MPVLSYVLPASALALLWPRLQRRVQLSRAKHRSLAGHSLMAKRLTYTGSTLRPRSAADKAAIHRFLGAA